MIHMYGLSWEENQMKKMTCFAAALSLLTVLTGCVNPFTERPLTEEQKQKYASHNV